MQLSRHNAEIIVKELNTIINDKINMMNEKGVIIASTDQERIGQEHEGAKRIINDRLEELIIHSHDRYEGSLEGVNYPIIISNEIIGVVGITGPYNKVAKYGQITKKMTEILIQEISIKEQKSMDENLRSRFVGEWLQNENVIINTNFVERGRRMGLEITNPRRVIIISVFDNGTGSDSLDEMRKVERVEERVKNVIRRLDPDSIYMKSSSNLVFAITNRKDPEIGKIGEMLRSTVEEQPDMKVVIGIDDKCRPYTMTVSYTHLTLPTTSSV